jgi:hypothetical protein
LKRSRSRITYRGSRSRNTLKDLAQGSHSRIAVKDHSQGSRSRITLKDHTHHAQGSLSRITSQRSPLKDHAQGSQANSTPKMASYNLRKRQPNQLMETSNSRSKITLKDHLLKITSQGSRSRITYQGSYNLRKRKPNQLLETSNLKKRKLNPKMWLENFSNEVLTEIFSYLGQSDLFLCVALLSKRFYELTKLRQFSKFVNYSSMDTSEWLHPKPKSDQSCQGRLNSLMNMLRINKHLEKLVLVGTGRSVTKILQIVKTHRYVCINSTEGTYVLFICSAISSSEKCLRVSKT